MNKIEEIWKDIPDYEGYYQASNLGRIRSLDRTVLTINGRERFYKGRIKDNVNNKGYKQYTLSINGVHRIFRGSQLVAMTFLGHKPNGMILVVDHISGDRSDDRVDNIRIVSHRANTSTCFRSDRDSLGSEYIGVHWHKKTSKWQSKIKHNGGDVHLGLYNTEVEASNAYQSALSKIKYGSFNPDNYKAKWTSEYKGVYYNKKEKKWVANIQACGNQIYIGSFPTEELAYKARLKAEEEVLNGSFLSNRKSKKDKSKPTP